jgi:Tfp pilus assembly protein PilN
MIKINLATRKQSSIGAASGASGLAGLFGGGNSGGGPIAGGGTKSFVNLRFDQLNLDQFRELPLAKVGLALVVVIGAYFVEASIKASEMAKVEESIVAVKQAEAELLRQLETYKGSDQIKKSLDADETMIRTKIQVIRKLIQDRQVPPKLLLALSNGLPQDVWISKFEVSELGIKIDGMSLGGLNPVADFIKNLGESTHFTDLKLVGSKKGKDSLNLETDDFQLTARRREVYEQ